MTVSLHIHLDANLLNLFAINLYHKGSRRSIYNDENLRMAFMSDIQEIVEIEVHRTRILRPDSFYHVNSTLAVSNIRNRTYTNCEVYLIDYGYGNFKEKIHFME